MNVVPTSSGESLVAGQLLTYQQPPAQQHQKMAKNNSKMRLSMPIKIISSISIVLGILSIGFQIATIVLFDAGIYDSTWDSLDYVASGIWGGVFYITSGALGVSASSAKHTKPLLISTLVFAILSLLSSTAAIVLSSIQASYGYISYYYYGNNYYYYTYCGNYPLSCNAWIGLEWTLFGVSVLVCINSIVLISIVSVPLCCGRPKKNPVNYGIQVQYPTGQPQPQYPMMMMTTTGQMVQVVPNQQSMVQQPYPVQLQPLQLQNYQSTPIPITY